jgi:RNA polymerase-binding protein DksA
MLLHPGPSCNAKAATGFYRHAALDFAAIVDYTAVLFGRKTGGRWAMKGSSGMRAREIDQFRKILLEKRRLLTGDVTALEKAALHESRQDASGDLSKVPLDMADVGSDNYEQEFNLGLIETEQATLTEIDEALERIEKRQFGKCVGCGGLIPRARLKVKPHAKYCIECKRREEKGLL